MKLIYNVQDRPSIGKIILFAFQQLLAIMAATIAVPSIINAGVPGAGMSQTAALFGAGVGTLVYLLFTKFKSPVFLGSSFAFIGSMLSAFAGAASMDAGYAGLIIGTVFAGLVYVVLSVIVKQVGVNWINRLMPPVIIGPTVAIIGLSLAGNAIGDLTKQFNILESNSSYVSLICGLTTLFTTIICSVYGKKMFKMVPFIIGILAGYTLATLFTVAGHVFENEALKVIDFSVFRNINWVPNFAFIKGIKGLKDITASHLGSIAVAYIPVAFVVFAEHIADHKNLSSIIENDLLENPGLNRTLLGDGVGSMAGAFFGGCPNTTYGESVGCVAISGNASVITIVFTAFFAILISFFGPFSTFLSTIPSCVMGGVCVALYGFIAVSGLKMIQKVNLNDNRNLFVVSVILISGVGGISLSFGKITLTTVACALLLGILTNLIVNLKPCSEDEVNEEEVEE